MLKGPLLLRPDNIASAIGRKATVQPLFILFAAAILVIGEVGIK